ncbi:DMT family transporter [Enterococcus faecalis]
MRKAWLKVVVGALFEVAWVIGMKYSTSWWEIAGTIIAIFISFYALIKAGERLPVGTAYAVFVGLGSAGTILADTFLFGASFHISKLIFLLTLLIGVIGLKMVTESNNTKEEEQ